MGEIDTVEMWKYCDSIGSKHSIMKAETGNYHTRNYHTGNYLQWD